MSSALKLVTAAVIITVLSIAPPTGVLAAEQVDGLALPGVSWSLDGDEPAIHWQTDRVDLWAESLTLELFDQTFSPEGAAVTITDDLSGKRRWYVDVRWTQDEHTHALILNFRHNDTDWYVDTVNWWFDDPRPSDGRGRYGSAAFRTRNLTRTPLGQAFTGDIQRSGTGVLASCEDTGIRLVEAVSDGGTLTLDGLHLTVAPRERNVFERALRYLGLTEGVEQDLGLLAEDCDDTGVLWRIGPDRDFPEPGATEESE